MERCDDPWTLGVPPRTASPANVLDLSGTAHPLGCAPHAARRIRTALGETEAGWKEALGRLTAGVSKTLSLPPACICVGAGTRVLLPAVLRALGGAAPSVALPAPAPPLHRLAAARSGARVIDLPLTPPFTYASQAWHAIVRRERPAVVLIANPSNPGGALLAAGDALALLHTAADCGSVLVVDEAYGDEGEAASATRLLPRIDEHRQLVLLRSFSSSKGLSGLPVGFALCHPDVAARLRPWTAEIQPARIAAEAAAAALEEPAFDQMIRERVARGRFTLAKAVRAWGLTCQAGAAPWIAARVRDSGETTRRLAAHGVRVRDLAAWGYPEWIRIRAGLEDEVTRFLSASEPVLTKAVP